MDIKPIKTEEDYRATLREIESLMRAEPGSPEGERLDVLVKLVSAYEQEHFPEERLDAIDTLLGARVESGEEDVAARHNEHQP